MPLIIFLVECGIELIPKEIRTHSAVRKNLSAQIYSSQLLDNALHHSAMVNLKNSEKRGRPDIAHLSLFILHLHDILGKGEFKFNGT